VIGTITHISSNGFVTIDWEDSSYGTYNLDTWGVAGESYTVGAAVQILSAGLIVLNFN
jgi:hypothetical protein